MILQLQILNVVASKDIHIKRIDVNTTFFHDEVECDIYKAYAECFLVFDKKNRVCKKKNNIY